MKKLFLFFVIMICLMACATKKQSIFTNLDCRKYPVLDSLGNIRISEEGVYEGELFNKIVTYNQWITPCLIEKIKDTTQTNITYADIYNYVHGDIAFFLLGYEDVTNSPIYIGDILYEEFKDEFLKSKHFFFKQAYSIVMFNNDAKTNYNNRLRLYKRLKRWYLENYINSNE
ncbi:hypothetical protein [Capnocytophaga canis]|uniref:hypothetical protein n=1 Tax=Capnocytophaga canis TaxID=1848903 RepID=UPI001561B784|nr:hypothetical protein [Capnocytophaga canis]